MITSVDAAIIELNYGLSIEGFVRPEDEPTEYSGIGLCLQNNSEEITATGSVIQRLLRTTVQLGTAENPVEGLYGISFTLLFDIILMEASTTFPIIRNEFAGFFGEAPPNISIGMAMPEQGRIDFSVSKTDGQEVNGYGELAEIWL